MDKIQRREQTWKEICRYKVKKQRFILSDIYASIILHETDATPREVVVRGILTGDRVITKKRLLQVCMNGHVLDALCWLRKRFPDLLTRYAVNLDAIPADIRHTSRAEFHYRKLVQSVEKWLDAWAVFVFE